MNPVKDILGKKKTLNFKSKAGYGKWLAYGHIHGLMHGGNQKIVIAGKKHKVQH